MLRGLVRFSFRSLRDSVNLKHSNAGNSSKSSIAACLHSSCRVFSAIEDNAQRKNLSNPNFYEFYDVKLSCDALKGAPYTLTKEQEEYLCGGDHDVKLKLDTLLMEMFVERQKGITLPPNIALDDLKTLIGVSRSQFHKILHRLYLKCALKEKGKQVRKEYWDALTVIRNEREEHVASLEYPWLQYRLFGNSLFPRFYVRSESHFYNLRLEQGRQFGQNIVFDCSYSKYMREYDIKSAAKQLLISIRMVKEDRRPFCLTFCNINKDERLFYYLKKQNPQIDCEVPVNFTEENYTKLFPRKDIVYLSPHCRYDLNYSPNDVYIIGALVDKVDKTAYSSAKAREDNVRIARLPIDRHVLWSQGSKSLCINQVVGVLQVVKNTGDWTSAFQKNLPSRKLTFYNRK